MKPVIQTRLSKETSGNCLQASIASLLELPLDHVPNFSELYRDLDRFHATLAGWLGQRGWKLQCYKPDGDLPDYAHISWERAGTCGDRWAGVSCQDRRSRVPPATDPTSTTPVNTSASPSMARSSMTPTQEPIRPDPPRSVRGGSLLVSKADPLVVF